MGTKTIKMMNMTKRCSWLLLTLTLLMINLLSFNGQVKAQQFAAKNREMKSEAIVPLRSHSIYAPYVDSNLQNKFWDFGGNAIVDTNRHIRLTQDRPHQMGWLWSRLPVSAESYEINVEFNLDGTSTSVHGDGFAMWLTTERNQPGPVFGSKNYFTGMGLFFDTFANARHSYTFPRVSLMLGNGVEAYDVSKDGEKTEIAGCSVDIRRPKVASKAKLTYVKGVYLELELHYKEWDTWESCFKLENIALPNEPYLGFSAFTGDVSDNHDLISVSTNHIVYKSRNSHQLKQHRDEIFRPDNDQLKKGKKKSWDSKNYFGGIGGGSSGSRASKSGGGGGGFFSNLFGFIWFIIKWALILAAIAGLVLVGLTYQRKRDAKRF